MLKRKDPTLFSPEIMKMKLNQLECFNCHYMKMDSDTTPITYVTIYVSSFCVVGVNS